MSEWDQRAVQAITASWGQHCQDIPGAGSILCHALFCKEPKGTSPVSSQQRLFAKYSFPSPLSSAVLEVRGLWAAGTLRWPKIKVPLGSLLCITGSCPLFADLLFVDPLSPPSLNPPSPGKSISPSPAPLVHRNPPSCLAEVVNLNVDPLCAEHYHPISPSPFPGLCMQGKHWERPRPLWVRGRELVAPPPHTHMHTQTTHLHFQANLSVCLPFHSCKQRETSPVWEINKS